jgi:hypothetical protein
MSEDRAHALRGHLLSSPSQGMLTRRLGLARRALAGMTLPWDLSRACMSMRLAYRGGLEQSVKSGIGTA